MFGKKNKESTKEPKYQHRSGALYSKELSDEEKRFIKSMIDYRDVVQIPMLVDKVCVLKNEIRKLNNTTTFFSIALIIFAIIQIIIMLN